MIRAIRGQKISAMKVASPQEVIRIGQIETRGLLEDADIHGALAVFKATIPLNARVPDSALQTR